MVYHTGAGSLRGFLNQENMPPPPVPSSRELMPLLDLPERKDHPKGEVGRMVAAAAAVVVVHAVRARR